MQNAMTDPHHATFRNLLTLIREAEPRVDIDLVTLAYETAQQAHAGQKRISGEDYIIHPLGVATYLADLHYTDTTTIIAGLLHDVIEDTSYTIDALRKDFGDEIADIVMGVTVLEKLKYRGVERYLENLRKMFVAMAKDLRVIFIKFADRIDNLKTLHVWPHEKQLRIAQETAEIYAPIANRLGMGKIRGELEDLAFPYIDPDAYTWTKNLLLSIAPKREKYLDDVKDIIKKALAKEKIKPVDIHGRAKHLFSLYRKLLRYDRDISRIYDIITMRIIVNNLADCYATMGIIHQRWRPLKGRIKDYIANPKPNGYQSLHTTVFCEKGEILEFQIRTKKMHEEAEFGVAAHWRYKERSEQEGGSTTAKLDLEWIRELTRWHKRIHDKEEQLQKMKLDVFQNRIFVFTPKGEIIDLPEDATPIDFAYHIHTEVGNHCSSAIVNDHLVPLDTKLRSGDIVEIVTDKKRKGPSPDWLQFVKTTTARSKIKSQVKVNIVDWLKNIVPTTKK